MTLRHWRAPPWRIWSVCHEACGITEPRAVYWPPHSLICSDSAVYDVFHLPSKIKNRRRDQLRHEDDIKIFHGIDPKEGRCQAAPVKITLTPRSRTRLLRQWLRQNPDRIRPLRYWSLKTRPLPSVLTIGPLGDCESSVRVWVCQSPAGP